MEPNATVAYSIHIVLLNFIKNFQMFLIYREHEIVGLLLAFFSGSSEETKDDVKAEGCDGKYGENIIPLTDDLPQIAN